MTMEMHAKFKQNAFKMQNVRNANQT